MWRITISLKFLSRNMCFIRKKNNRKLYLPCARIDNTNKDFISSRTCELVINML